MVDDEWCTSKSNNNNDENNNDDSNDDSNEYNNNNDNNIDKNSNEWRQWSRLMDPRGPYLHDKSIITN